MSKKKATRNTFVIDADWKLKDQAGLLYPREKLHILRHLEKERKLRKKNKYLNINK